MILESKYSFVMRVKDGKRVTVRRGDKVEVTSDEYKRLRNKFVDNANSLQREAREEAKLPKPGRFEAVDRIQSGYR